MNNRITEYYKLQDADKSCQYGDSCYHDAYHDYEDSCYHDEYVDDRYDDRYTDGRDD